MSSIHFQLILTKTTEIKRLQLKINIYLELHLLKYRKDYHHRHVCKSLMSSLKSLEVTSTAQTVLLCWQRCLRFWTLQTRYLTFLKLTDRRQKIRPTLSLSFRTLGTIRLSSLNHSLMVINYVCLKYVNQRSSDK